MLLHTHVGHFELRGELLDAHATAALHQSQDVPGDGWRDFAGVLQHDGTTGFSGYAGTFVRPRNRS